MTKLERLQQSYQYRLTNLKYNYATELLDNISDYTYSDLLETNKDLFDPICNTDADDYLRKPDVLDSIIDLLERTIAKESDLDVKRQEIVSYITNLTEDQITKVEDFIETRLDD